MEKRRCSSKTVFSEKWKKTLSGLRYTFQLCRLCVKIVLKMKIPKRNVVFFIVKTAAVSGVSLKMLLFLMISVHFWQKKQTKNKNIKIQHNKKQKIWTKQKNANGIVGGGSFLGHKCLSILQKRYSKTMITLNARL